MVGPARKREAVVHLEDKFQVSQRRACKSLAQPRSTQRYVCRLRGKEAALVEDLRRFSTKHPRAGYRMAHKQLRREGGRQGQPQARAEAVEAGRPASAAQAA